jgi:hypothetical protein
MSHEERNTWVAMATNLAVSLYVVLRLRALAAEGALAGDEGLQVMARTILWAIPVAIVLTIVLTILFNIVFAIATRDENPDFTVDERDRLFRARAMTVTLVVMSGGVIAAFAALAFGWSALVGFALIYAGCALGDFAGNALRLYTYRTGG